MAQKLIIPKTETELKDLLDFEYFKTQELIEVGKRPAFENLLEVISSETVILSAIHKLKANHGSKTPGVDGKVMQEDILESKYEEVISKIKEALKNYKPDLVKRKFIPKPGKTELRPLGVPTIMDRIIQECVRLVIEPIMEAQFFNHSYGYRPLRGAHMAKERVESIIHLTGYHWVVEGDIIGFFDNVNHTVLIKKLWHMGIHDKRVLMIIKSMLKAGIMYELNTIDSLIGTPQGGIISPLLANIYLNSLDKWITREWECKKTRINYAGTKTKYQSLRERSNLKPAFFIRYADDWVLITNSKENAEKWKHRISIYLHETLKLSLSDEKTLITNVTKRAINFVGFEIKCVKIKAKKGYITRSYANPQRLDLKMKEVHKEIKQLRHIPDKKQLIIRMMQINSIIRGIIQYYKAASWISIQMRKYKNTIMYASFKSLKKFGGKWTPANEVSTLCAVHKDYNTQIPAIEYNGMLIGITSPAFCKWEKSLQKNPQETIYTRTGRELLKQRTGKRPILVRADEIFDMETTILHLFIAHKDGIHNFEYFLNRPYTFNRDKGKCGVCGANLYRDNVQIHHRSPKLPLSKVNKVQYLISLCKECHKKVHNKVYQSGENNKVWKKIEKLRKELCKTV